MNKIKKNLEKQLKSFQNNNQTQLKQINELEIKVNQLQKDLSETKKEQKEINEKNSKLQIKLKEAETNRNEIKEENSRLQIKLKETETNRNEIKEENSRLQIKLKETEKIKSDLQKQIDENILKISGKIDASVEEGLIINAQINLIPDGSSIDFTKSKYIVSRSDKKILGQSAYEKGELITSLPMKTKKFICKSGTYYVRCLIFDESGKSIELMSNPVITKGSSVSFMYEGKVSNISLLEGKYKLEVWGAKGGDSEGSRGDNSPPPVGGLGGYSRGILTLKEPETVYICVGGQGQPANSQDGATTNGGFPDGGGTKTGHFCNEYTSVPGTGGGSTSIRIKSNSEYSRVIVAGGGGGASGNFFGADGGGFGGGLNGGNCIYNNKLRDQGSGTQTGSTCGLGVVSNGDPGKFGLGATGKYKSGGDSGGGGGGGWYGGGSGGCGKPGCSLCSGGGGGSGWTFTESSFATWKSGDSTNASKFLLSSSYYLTDAITVNGDKEIPRPDGTGIETGHHSNGYAKITPE